MSSKLTILCENSVERVSPAGLIGEHGFACHLQTERGDYLFDTGSGQGLIPNSERLGIKLSQLQGAILSHGHRDHTGGLKQLLKKTGSLAIHAHPDLFSHHQSNNDGELRDIGIPWERSELEGLGGEFHLSSAPQRITPELTCSGEIPRIDAASADANLVIRSTTGKLETDPLADDLSLFINSSSGLVILLGCAHAGLCNIIEQAFTLTGQTNIALLLGGTHLKFCTEQQLEATLDRLEEYQIDKIGVSHCTGLRPAQKIAARFGDRFLFASVGTEISI